MKTFATLLLLSLASLSFGQSGQPGTAEIVQFPSEQLHLKGYLWKPSGPGPFPAVLFRHGSGGPDAMQTSGMPMKEAAETLAPVFVKHGYAFFYPCRRGHGLSADQGKFIQESLKDEEAAKGIKPVRDCSLRY
jgi:carboxymethylenebutenolidase